MVNRQSFGRRINPQPASGFARAKVEAEAPAPKLVPAEIPGEPIATVQLDAPILHHHSMLDDELEKWKQARKSGFNIPWRQLSLMASLCFGIASFELPDSVNDNVQWVLYALMAASFFAGLSKRRRKAAG